MTQVDGDETRGMRRRTVLGIGLAGAAGVTLAACGGSGGSSSGEASASSEGPRGEASPPPEVLGTVIATTGEIGVGEVKIVQANDTGYVLAQPSEGEFVAHSAVCPHQGCLCNQVQGNEVICPCHGSRFNGETGEVLQGPAKTGLAQAQISEEGDQILLS